MPPSPLLSARITKRQIFDRDDDHQRPEHERQHSEDMLGVDHLEFVRVALERLAQRVERAGADVAVDDAERAEREQGGRRLGVAVMAACCFRLGVAPLRVCRHAGAECTPSRPGSDQHQKVKAR